MNQQLQLLLREKRYIQARFESVKKIKDIKNENIDFNETMPIRSLDFESNSERYIFTNIHFTSFFF